MILSNQVLCNHCGETPWSSHRHDFVYCGCIDEAHKIAVDGGMDYLRRVAGNKADYRDLSISLDPKHIAGLIDAFSDKKKNDMGKVCSLVRYLRDEMDINVTEREEA